MPNQKFTTLVSLTLASSLILAACRPTPTVVPATVTVTPQLDYGLATATPRPTIPPVPNVMVVCMAQEPATLYTLSESAFVKNAVLEAVYDWGVDQRSYDYQAVGLKKLPNFADGDAVKTEVAVKVGDKVYDAATDAVVTIEPTSTVTLKQLDGTLKVVDFGKAEAAKNARTVQLAVTWALADGLTWEDGTPVTTADVLFAWAVASSPDSPNSKYIIDRTVSYEAVDDQSWTWTALPGFTTGTYFQDALVTPLPSHIYGAGGANPLTPAQMLADEAVNRDPLAFGPFKIAEWVPGKEIVLTRNPTYYRASEGLPKLDTLIYRFVPDTNALIARVAEGECDLGTQDAELADAVPLLQTFEAQGLLKLQLAIGPVFEQLGFNLQPTESYEGFAGTVKNADGTPIFANLAIRQALAMCLDRQAMVEQVTTSTGVVQHTYTPAAHPLYAGEAALTRYPFDAAQALQLLAANGWTDTDSDGILDDGQGTQFAFILSANTSSAHEKVAEMVQSQLRANCMLEIELQLCGFECGSFGLAPGEFDLALLLTQFEGEPPCHFYSGPDNFTGFNHAAFDQACLTALNTTDAAEKAAQHAVAQKIFAQELPALPLYAPAKVALTGPNVVGVMMDPTASTELWNVENFDITNE